MFESQLPCKTMREAMQLLAFLRMFGFIWMKNYLRRNLISDKDSDFYDTFLRNMVNEALSKHNCIR